eukprot:sb/3461064/
MYVPQRSAQTGVKIKIKILILSSHTPAAVKIPLPHSKSNDLARHFNTPSNWREIVTLRMGREILTAAGVCDDKIKILILILTPVCADPNTKSITGSMSNGLQISSLRTTHGTNATVPSPSNQWKGPVFCSSQDEVILALQPLVRSGRKWRAGEELEEAGSDVRCDAVRGMIPPYPRAGIGFGEWRKPWEKLSDSEKRGVVMERVRERLDQERTVETMQLEVQGMGWCNDNGQVRSLSPELSEGCYVLTPFYKICKVHPRGVVIDLALGHIYIATCGRAIKAVREIVALEYTTHERRYRTFDPAIYVIPRVPSSAHGRPIFFERPYKYLYFGIWGTFGKPWNKWELPHVIQRYVDLPYVPLPPSKLPLCSFQHHRYPRNPNRDHNHRPLPPRCLCWNPILCPTNRLHPSWSQREIRAGNQDLPGYLCHRCGDFSLLPPDHFQLPRRERSPHVRECVFLRCMGCAVSMFALRKGQGKSPVAGGGQKNGRATVTILLLTGIYIFFNTPLVLFNVLGLLVMSFDCADWYKGGSNFELIVGHQAGERKLPGNSIVEVPTLHLNPNRDGLQEDSWRDGQGAACSFRPTNSSFTQPPNESSSEVSNHEVELEPSRLTLLSGESSDLKLKVYGDTSTLTLSNKQLTTVKNIVKSTDWLTYYDIAITNADTAWNGTLSAEILYTDDKELITKTSLTYITDVRVTSYSENIAEGKDIILTCAHSTPTDYNAPTVTWLFSKTEDGATTELKNGDTNVTITNGRDTSKLLVSGVYDPRSGFYSCSVVFNDADGKMAFSKDSTTRQNVVGEAYFADLQETMSQKIGDSETFTCDVTYGRPTGNIQNPIIGVQCLYAGDTETWITKGQRQTSSSERKFVETFSVEFIEEMNNQDCRCFGQFATSEGVLSSSNSYIISSPLTRVYAYKVFIVSVEDHFAMIGHGVTMQCGANGLNPDNSQNIQWKGPGDNALTDGVNGVVIKAEPVIEGVYKSTIVVPNLNADSEGTYACYVNYGTDKLLQQTFNVYILRIHQYNTATRYEMVDDSNVKITCKVSKIGDKIPTVTWTHDGEKSTCDVTNSASEGRSRRQGGGDSSNLPFFPGNQVTCVKTITIQSDPLTTLINCHLEYENQALLRGQEEQSGNLTIVTQKVWSEQKKVNVVKGSSPEYTCYGSGNRATMNAKINYDGSENPVESLDVDGETYVKKFKFVLTNIAKEADYQCTVNFDTTASSTVALEVNMMGESTYHCFHGDGPKEISPNLVGTNFIPINRGPTVIVSPPPSRCLGGQDTVVWCPGPNHQGALYGNWALQQASLCLSDRIRKYWSLIG